MNTTSTTPCAAAAVGRMIVLDRIPGNGSIDNRAQKAMITAATLAMNALVVGVTWTVPGTSRIRPK